MARDSDPHGQQPPAKGEQFEQRMTRLGGVSYKLSCTTQSSCGIHVLQCWQIASNHLLRGPENMLLLVLSLAVEAV